MPSYFLDYDKPSYVVLGSIQDQLDILAAANGIVIETMRYHSDSIPTQVEIVTDIALTGPQQTALANALAAYDVTDYPALTQAAKVNAKDVLSDIEEVYTFALTRWSGLSGAQKLAVLTTLTTGWGGASAAQKADALRDLLSLVVVAIYFIYLKFISNGA